MVVGIRNSFRETWALFSSYDTMPPSVRILLPRTTSALLRRSWRIRPSRVDRPNWKAECAETCLLRLERGKGCEALPIATHSACILWRYRDCEIGRTWPASRRRCSVVLGPLPRGPLAYIEH